MVTRNAMNRADMLARTTQDRIAAAIGAGEPPGPSHGSHRERHEKEAADATAWDGRDVASSGESSDETLDSDDLPMLKKHRHVGGSPEREQFRRHRRHRPAERREMATAVILEEGPLAVAVGLSGPAFLDPAAAGLTLSEIKEVLQSVRTKVRQAQAWKADAAHSLSATRGTLAAARRVGMSAVPSPSRTAGADEQGWEHSAREADSAAGDRLAGDASARSRMMDDTGPAVAAVPSTSGRGGRDSVGLSQSVDGSVREGILPESAVSKAAMSLRTEAVMR